MKLHPWVGDPGCFVCMKLTSILQTRVEGFIFTDIISNSKTFKKCGFRESSFSESKKAFKEGGELPVQWGDTVFPIAFAAGSAWSVIMS